MLLCLVMAMAVLKLLIVAIVIAGLIFETRTTLGFLLIGGTVTLTAAYPALGSGAIAATVALAVIMSTRERKAAKALDDPDQE